MTAQTQEPAIGADVLTRVKELRAQGEALHNSSTHADSVGLLNEAKQLLGI